MSLDAPVPAGHLLHLGDGGVGGEHPRQHRAVHATEVLDRTLKEVTKSEYKRGE